MLRGRVLSFVAEPQGPDDPDSHIYLENGAVLIEAGKIVAVGDFSQMEARVVETAKIVDHRPHLIMPGFIDAHLHSVQMQVVGSWAPALLEWLNTYTFVEEQRFGDPVHAHRLAAAFFDEMIRHGTTTPVAFCSVHAASADAYFEEAVRRNMAVIGGKLMMDRNAPEALTDSAQTGFDQSKALIEKWHGKGRARYAISPRFAITSTPEQLSAAGALAAEFPDCYVQTHAAENAAEIALTKKLYPEATDYVGVYEGFGLLGPKSLLGHAIHLSDREISVMAETGSVAVFCPTSNLFLGSGLFDRQRLQARGVRTAIATDIGGGTSYSMLQTLNEGHKVLQMRGQLLPPLTAFYMITLGNARALSLEGTIGSLLPGADADLVIVDAYATPAMALRMQTVTSLNEELFVLQTLGDDRAIAETYVAGRAVKSALA